MPQQPQIPPQNLVDLAKQFGGSVFTPPQPNATAVTTPNLAQLAAQFQTPPELNTFQKLTQPTANALLSAVPGVYQMLRHPLDTLTNAANVAQQRGAQVMPDVRQGNYGGAAWDLAGSVPFVAPVEDQAKRSADAFSTGDPASGVGNILPLILSILGPKIAEGAGVATENVGPAIAETGLGVPMSLKRNYGQIGRAVVNPDEPLSNAYTFPGKMRSQLANTEGRIQSAIAPFDAANGPTVSPLNNILNAVDYASNKGRVEGASTQIADESQLAELANNAFDALPTTNNGMRTLQEAIAAKRSEGLRGNWSTQNTDNLDALFHEGLSRAYRDSVTQAVPSVSDLLSQEQGQMGAIEAYDRRVNAPSNPLRSAFEVGSGLGTAALAEQSGLPAWYGAGATLGLHAMRSPNIMAATGMTVDALRRAILNSYSGGLGGFAGLSFAQDPNKQ